MLTSDSWDCDAMLGGDSMRYAIIVLALLGLLASPRPAAGDTGNEILEICGMGGETVSLAPSDQNAVGYVVIIGDVFWSVAINDFILNR